MGIAAIIIVIGQAGDIVRPRLEIIIIMLLDEAGAVAIVVGKG